MKDKIEKEYRKWLTVILNPMGINTEEVKDVRT
jgi:hypothetical protein